MSNIYAEKTYVPSANPWHVALACPLCQGKLYRLPINKSQEGEPTQSPQIEDEWVCLVDRVAFSSTNTTFQFQLSQSRNIAQAQLETLRKRFYCHLN